MSCVHKWKIQKHLVFFFFFNVAKKYSAALVHGVFVIPDTQCFDGGPRVYSKSDICVAYKCWVYESTNK